MRRRQGGGPRSSCVGGLGWGKEEEGTISEGSRSHSMLWLFNALRTGLRLSAGSAARLPEHLFGTSLSWDWASASHLGFLTKRGCLPQKDWEPYSGSPGSVSSLEWLGQPAGLSCVLFLMGV